jgi:sialic acid synthase
MRNLPPKLVAEVGCNHMGDFSHALKMIESAASHGADFVKFQKRSLEKYRANKNLPHPDSKNSFGATYFEHRKKLEFSIDQHKKLKLACEEYGVKYAVSVWDLESFEEVRTLAPEYIKIPSAENLNFSLLRSVMESGFPIHLSLGMITRAEKEEIFRFFETNEFLSKVTFYSCTSSYPTEVGELYLGEITELRNRFSNHGAGFGFSGHYLGTNLDSVAFALGATWIERHFTLDKTQKGSDQMFSLLPEELLSVKKNLLDGYAAVRLRPEDIVSSETSTREKLKSSGFKSLLL